VDLGRLGVWTSYRAIGAENAGAAARLVEQLGYGTFWLGGSPRLEATRPLLSATEGLTVATGIVNIWQYQPPELAAEHAALRDEYPGRLMLGVGVGHPEARSDYRRPLSAMNGFLDGLDQAVPPVPRAQRCVAALGPKMLELAAARSSGAIPYFVPVDHTRFAREQLGSGALLAPEVACVIEEDEEHARSIARKYAGLYLNLSNYTENLRRFGYTDQDLDDGGSDRLIDAVIPHGSAEQIATAVQAHFDAGADHVCLQPLGAHCIPAAQWAALAQALAG
jgi:probable F420-dependent oxidoreductase